VVELVVQPETPTAAAMTSAAVARLQDLSTVKLRIH
jgi:hypothetical protein